MCIIPFIDVQSEKLSNEDIIFPFIWQQKRYFLTGKYAGGHHVCTYGMLQNIGDYRLKSIRFLHPGRVAYIKDLSTDVWAPGEGPDQHWNIKILKSLSKEVTALSVCHPYPQGYIFLRGPCRLQSYIGTVREHSITVNYPPPPLVAEDLDFKKILRQPGLSFISNKVACTADKKIIIQLQQLIITETIHEVFLEPGESRFFAYELFTPNRAVKQTEYFSQWSAFGPSLFLTRLGTEINKLVAFRRELEVKSDSLIRFQQFVNRIRNGFCEIVEFWSTLAFEDKYKSVENIPPMDVYHSGWAEGGGVPYQSKTWIFNNLDFYIVSVVTPRKNT